MRALWHRATIAHSDDTIVVEGNHYFPRASVVERFLEPSQKRSTCLWKGKASYFDVCVGDEVNRDAAWSYPAPKKAAGEIRDHVAFWRGISIEA